MWATVLFDEVADLGYDRAYQTFTRKVRERDLRPHCAPCASSTGRATVDIEHPPGEEIQWDWLELAHTPWGRNAYVLVGALSHSSRRRGWFCDSDDQAMAMQIAIAPRRWISSAALLHLARSGSDDSSESTPPNLSTQNP